MAKKLEKLSDKEHAVDTQVACGMIGLALFSDQGVQSMVQVVKGAKDQAAALAHVIFLVISKVRTALVKKGIRIDPRVWIAGGGVLDRVIFDAMTILYAAAKFEPAINPMFVHQVKSAVLDLMHADDQNGESIKTLHEKGLPIPSAPQQTGPPQGGGGGLVAPQGQPQAPNGGQQ